MTTKSRTGTSASYRTFEVASPLPPTSEPREAGGRSLVAAQVAASVGVSAVAAAGGIAASDMAGAPSAAMPLGALVIGSGAGAVTISRITQRHSRSTGLHIGYDLAIVGAVIGLLALGVGSLVLLLAGTALIGVGNSAVMLSRYALADLAPTDQRARTIGRSLFAVAAGSILGPLLLDPAGRVAEAFTMPALSGTYAAAAVVFAFAAVALAAGRTRSRPGGPNPTDTTASAPAPHQPSGSTVRAAGRALCVLATANLTMVTMMAVYPGHLHHTGHGFGITSIIVSAHVCSMFAASPMLGRCTDRYGANRVAALGATTIAGSCMLTATLPSDDALIAALALILLGVGWNAQLVAGSALLTADAMLDQRAKLEGHGEIAMSAAAAAGALVLAPLLISQASIRTLAATMIPVHAIVIASTTSLLTRRPRQALRLETTR